MRLLSHSQHYHSLNTNATSFFRSVAIMFAFCFCIVATNDVQAQSTVPGWRSAAAMPQALSGHRSALLHTGDVLVCGGMSAGGSATTASYLYHDGRWINTENQLQNARAYHALVAVRLQNGVSRVFAIGGYTGSAASASSIPSVEVLDFNAAQGTWSWRMIGNLPAAVGSCAAAWDAHSFVIVSGGRVQTSAPLGTGTATALSARINISSFVIERLGDMSTARSEHAALMLLSARNDSTVLSANGEVNNTPATEILNATVWDARANPPAFQQRDASNFTDIAAVARMVGGTDATGAPSSKGQWYDTKSGWRAMPRMQTARSKAPICLIAGIKDTSSNYLIAGGETGGSRTAACEIFSLPGGGTPNGAWSPFSPMISAAAERCLAIEAHNLALSAGGQNGGTILSGAELFQPLDANDLNFGQEEVGRESPRTIVHFKNTWLLPVRLSGLRIPGSAEFRLTSALDSILIAPGGSIDIDVRFRPAVVGPRSAWLLANVGPIVDSVKLVGEGIKSTITVLSQTIDFGQRLLLNDSTICFPAIRNDGKDTTVIDSVVITPAGQYTVISPVGRTRIAPDSTMIVCVRFRPNARQIFGAGTEVHIADRVYAVTMTGTGIRRFLSTTTQLGCDTVTVAPGDSLAYQLVVSNNSDRDVTVDSTIIKTALAGTFRLASPSPFPFTLSVGSSKTITIIFAPQREAQEQASVQFVNNGDTLCIAKLCFVPRNRSVNINVPQSAALRLCEGDSVTIPLVLENPGNFDALKIDSVYVRNMPGRIIGFAPSTLQPHQTLSIEATFVPTASGSQNASIVVLTNQGQSQSSIPLNVLPSIHFKIADTVGGVGGQAVLRISRTDGLNAPAQSSLRLRYNGSVLHPLLLRNHPGKSYINEASSSLTSVYGMSTLSIVWNSHPANTDDVFDVVCDVLRGDDLHSDVEVLNDSSSNVCVLQAVSSFDINNLCGGRSSLIRTESAISMSSLPSPVDDHIKLHIVADNIESSVVRVCDVNGIVLKTIQAKADCDISCSDLAVGMYLCQLLQNGSAVLNMPITIIR